MPRAPLALILMLFSLAACDREPAEAPPAPAQPAAQRIREAPPESEAPAPPPIDLKGLDEDAAIVALMKHELASGPEGDREAFARFRPVAAAVLLDSPADLLPDYLRPSEPAAMEDLSRAVLLMVQQQVPAPVRDAIRAGGRAKVLAVETCGADVGSAFGIPNDFDEGSAQPYLDQARFDLAMEHETLTPVQLPANFRDMEGDREAVAALNQQLFDLRGAGTARDILVVLDLSADCTAAERQVQLVTEPEHEGLRILPAFFQSICAQRAEDAWSPEQCRWWREATQPQTMVRGTYYYVANWPDGVEKRGRFVIDALVTEAIEEGQEALTLDIR
ncbi:MAG: hypothetical protein AB7O49_13305 [Sphingomonadales bacterium]